jgi:hypothetical protein
MSKEYTITRIPGGALQLRAEALVYEKDAKGRNTGASHVETEVTSIGCDIGNASKETKHLAERMMEHYYGAANDPGAAAEVQRKVKPFLDAFLLHHELKPGGRLVISSDVLDRFFSL